MILDQKMLLSCSSTKYKSYSDQVTLLTLSTSSWSIVCWLCNQGIKIDQFFVETAFGAITLGPEIDPTKNKLGHEVMQFMAKVMSECCKVAVLHPLQLLQTHFQRPKEQACQSSHLPDLTS
jgi:hypothetical protein